MRSRSYDVIDAAVDAAWTPTASIELEAARDTFLFLSATRGFKSGGVNITAQEPGSAFRPELAWSYALVHGRTTFVPRSRRWDVSVYVRNLGRQEYVTATWDATADLAVSGRPGEPRHWGTQFTIRR